MLPELKLKLALPGFGRIELLGENFGNEEIFQEISIRFIPSGPWKDNHGVLIVLRRNGKCLMREIKTPSSEESFEGIGVS